MPWQKKLMPRALGTMCLCTVAWWWACDFHKVAPSDTLTTSVSDVVRPFSSIDKISNMGLEDILRQLADCRTPEQAALALRLLFDKTGIQHSTSLPAPPVPQSKFGVFYLPQEALEKLATWHVSFVTGKDEVRIKDEVWKVRALKVEESFGCMISLHEYVDRELELKVDLEKALKKLQQDAEKTVRNLETPENALVATIIAEGAAIPEKIPLYEPQTLRSPVQHFLLALWLTVEYGQLKATPAPVHKKHLCLLRCLADLVVDVLFCRFEIDLKATDDCAHRHANDFIECTQSCLHDQGGGGGR